MFGRILGDIGRVYPTVQWAELRRMTKNDRKPPVQARKSPVTPEQARLSPQIPKPNASSPGQGMNMSAPLCCPPWYPHYPQVELKGCPPLYSPRSFPLYGLPSRGCSPGEFSLCNTGCYPLRAQPTPNYNVGLRACGFCQCLSCGRPLNIVCYCCPTSRSPPFNMTGPPPCCAPQSYNTNPPCYYQYNPYASPWTQPFMFPEQCDPTNVNIPEEHSPQESKKQVQVETPKSK